MYVLMDIEWVQNDNGRRWPTQIAAMRVDEELTFLHMFFSRIRPSSGPQIHIFDKADQWEVAWA